MTLSLQSVDCRLLQTLSVYVCVCVCVCVSVCVSVPLLRLISRYYGSVLIKLGENVGTLVQLIVLKFHKNRFSFDVIMTSFLFCKKLFLRRGILLKGIQIFAKGNNYDALDCEASARQRSSCPWLKISLILEAFRERRHLHVCDLGPWVVTLNLCQGQIGLCH